MVNPVKTADSHEWASQSKEWENHSGQMQLEYQTVSQQKGMLVTVSRKPKQNTQLSRFPWITPTQWLGRFLGTNRSKIYCFTSSTGNMLQSFGFSFIKLRYILEVPLKWWVIFLKSRASTGCSSNSTSSSVTSGRFALFIARTWWGHAGITPIFPHEILSEACGIDALILG